MHTPEPAQATLRDLARHRPWRSWILASLLSRLPQAMLPLVWVLVAKDLVGSLTLGATLGGVCALSACVCSPTRGRLLDRSDLRRAIQIDGGLSLTIYLALWVVVSAGLPVWVLFVLSAAQGWNSAGIMSGLRALLVVVVPVEQLRRAHFVESLLTELCFAIGPLLVGAIALAAGAPVAVGALAGVQALAVFALFRVGSLRPTPTPRSRLFGDRAIRRLTFLVVALVTGFGILESNVAQRMDEFDLRAGAAGWFLGLFAIGSCLGGLIVSFRPLRQRGTYLVPGLLFLAFAAMNVPVVLATTPLVYAVAVPFSTVAFVPLTGFVAAEFEHELSKGRRGEGFSYMISGTMLGAALGYLVNGFLIGPVPPRYIPLISIGLFSVVGALLLTVRHRLATGNDLASRSEGLSKPPCPV